MMRGRIDELNDKYEMYMASIMKLN